MQAGGGGGPGQLLQETDTTAGLLPGPAPGVELPEPTSAPAPAQRRLQRTKCQHGAQTFHLSLQSTRTGGLPSGKTTRDVEGVRAGRSEMMRCDITSQILTPVVLQYIFFLPGE